MGAILENLSSEELCDIMCPDPLMAKLEDSGICEDSAHTATALDRVFDEALVGFAEEGRFVYSYEKLIQAYMDSSGASLDEAIDYIDSDILGRYQQFGEQPPIIMYEVN